MLSIKSRYNDRVLFEGEFATVKELLEVAARSDANLSYANLSYANLSDANLRGANLSYANLSYAKWTESLTLEMPPVQVGGLRYFVTAINGTHLQIGCKLHSVDDWDECDDEEIDEMDDDALVFWKQWKEPLLAIARGMVKAKEEATA